MGLKITRTQDHSRLQSGTQPESSTLMSARYEYEAVTGSRSAITVNVSEFSDKHDSLNDEAAKSLFNHLWKRVETDHRSDVVLDFSTVNDISPRFRRELHFLRRRIHRQGRSVRLLNVKASIDKEGHLEIM